MFSTVCQMSSKTISDVTCDDINLNIQREIAENQTSTQVRWVTKFTYSKKKKKKVKKKKKAF